MKKFLDGSVVIYNGDCLKVLPKLPANSADSCVTDPPYHLVSIVKRFGSPTAKPVRVPDPDAVNCIKAAHARAAAGFMGKTWDGGDIAARPEVWREIYRVLKPGAHLLAFGGTRTYHRMACAIEDAGFEIRDTIMWVYGSGFPKSHDVSKGIDRAAGVEREVIGSYDVPGYAKSNVKYGTQHRSEYTFDKTSNEPATNVARQWQGWGSALKPAVEPIVLARKPLSEKTVAANVLRWGTGALNIDGCRVPTEDSLGGGAEKADTDSVYKIDGWARPWMQDPKAREAHSARVRVNVEKAQKLGRWPANLVHDGSAEVVAAFPDSKSCNSPSAARCEGTILGGSRIQGAIYPGEDGSAARFFYTAKADADDRLGSKHPTIKPIDLMRYLVRLVTPPKGVCLDPFCGTGTTGEAAWREGMRAVLIEAEKEYQADIVTRMTTAKDYYAREVAKMRRHKIDMGPFFQKKDKGNVVSN